MASTDRSVEGYTRGLLMDGILKIAHKGMKVLRPEMIRHASAGGDWGMNLFGVLRPLAYLLFFLHQFLLMFSRWLVNAPLCGRWGT
jgi:hypothetical protein